MLSRDFVVVTVHRSLVSLVKSTRFVIPTAIMDEIGRACGSVTGSTPKDYIKATVAKSQINGVLKVFRGWEAEYRWVLSAAFLDAVGLDASDELLPPTQLQYQGGVLQVPMG